MIALGHSGADGCGDGSGNSGRGLGSDPPAVFAQHDFPGSDGRRQDLLAFARPGTRVRASPRELRLRRGAALTAGLNTWEDDPGWP